MVGPVLGGKHRPSGVARSALTKNSGCFDGTPGTTSLVGTRRSVSGRAESTGSDGRTALTGRLPREGEEPEARRRQGSGCPEPENYRGARPGPKHTSGPESLATGPSASDPVGGRSPTTGLLQGRTGRSDDGKPQDGPAGPGLGPLEVLVDDQGPVPTRNWDVRRNTGGNTRTDWAPDPKLRARGGVGGRRYLSARGREPLTRLRGTSLSKSSRDSPRSRTTHVGSPYLRSPVPLAPSGS